MRDRFLLSRQRYTNPTGLRLAMNEIIEMMKDLGWKKTQDGWEWKNDDWAMRSRPPKSWEDPFFVNIDTDETYTIREFHRLLSTKMFEKDYRSRPMGPYQNNPAMRKNASRKGFKPGKGSFFLSDDGPIFNQEILTMLEVAAYDTNIDESTFAALKNRAIDLYLEGEPKRVAIRNAIAEFSDFDERLVDRRLQPLPYKELSRSAIPTRGTLFNYYEREALGDRAFLGYTKIRHPYMKKRGPLVSNPIRRTNTMYRRNVSDQRKALREKYRVKHGNDWWQDDSIKAKFDAELKKTPKGSFTRGGVSLSEEVDEGIEFAKKRAKAGDKDFTYKEMGKSRGRGKKKQVATKAKTDKFVNYVHSFYGPGEVSSINATKKEVRDAVKAYFDAFSNTRSKYKELVPRGGFDGDSIDRENVFIILMDMTGREPAASKSRGRGKKRKEKVIKKKFYSESFYDKVDIAIQKKLAPIVDKGVSEMDAIDAEEVGWSVGDFATLELSDNKDIWFLQMKAHVNLPSGGIKAVSKSIEYDATPTKIANEAVKLYKRYINKYGPKKSSSRKSSSKSLNTLKGAGLKRLAKAIETFIPIIKGTVKVEKVTDDGAHLILGTSKYHLVFEVDPEIQFICKM